jgi:hypothetical protein
MTLGVALITGGIRPGKYQSIPLALQLKWFGMLPAYLMVQLM